MDTSKRALIFIDVDGTIYDPELDRIDPQLLDSVERVRENGHLVFLATGRASSFLPPGLFPSTFDGYVLAHGNQVLYHDKTIYSHLLPEEMLTDLVDTFNKQEIDFVLYSEDKIYLNRYDSDLYRFLLTQGVEEDQFYPLDNPPLSRIYRIEAWDKENLNWDQILRPFGELKWAYDPESLRIDINLKGAKKSEGIKRILDCLGDSFQTVCFGNALNDLDMFELVDFPIAVRNGDRRLKKKAKMIAPSVLENGVGQILEKSFTKNKPAL